VTNPHPDGFLAQAAQARPGRILDCGSGGRSLAGVTSLEYVSTPGADVRADGAHLPFPDATFALALSQAVLEHVPDPQAHVDELWRVLEPGGYLWVEVAFLQPVHMAPHHFFNVTPHGLDLLLGRWDVTERFTIGSLGELWDWVARDLRAERILPTATVERVSKALKRFSSGLTPDEARAVACGVGALAMKPLPVS
jgi:SAM-dependent methyltransferase